MSDKKQPAKRAASTADTDISNTMEVTGEFVTLADERFYAIRNVDNMAPFFISLVSDSDHWMFVASNGGLTAGRVSPETALFPYVTVDKIYDSVGHTGCETVVRLQQNGQCLYWEPFNGEHDGRFEIQRNLYKSVLGNKLLFEEINHDLELAFRYSWSFSDSHGFVRNVDLKNLGNNATSIELVDGLQNLLPAGTPRFAQTNTSYLVDAYKWSELDASTGLALYTLFSGITDRAEPCESLKATTVFCVGLEQRRVLLSTAQLDAFRQGGCLKTESHKRGIRGAYLVNASLEVAPQESVCWQLVADVEQTQSDTVKLIGQLGEPQAVAAAVNRSVEKGSDTLARIMAAADGFQLTAEENVSVHHYANVMFNVLRGGIANNNYQVSSADFRHHVNMFNGTVGQRHRALLDGLPEELDYAALLLTIQAVEDAQLERLVLEYLPLTFGRRHGDPSRPWNQFAIRLRDEQGNRLLTYQGNWRDIFQNWEALLVSYPVFIESVIAKFVNASTVDGYNPYRITNEGIDWEVEEPDDPWSYIGYWGDHQIIYLQKLLELSDQFHPDRLGHLLHQPLFSYANVPYKIKPFEAVLDDAKNTVEYDDDLAHAIEQRTDTLGSDGKLLPGADGDVYQVTLLEKLLVPLLAKLGNLVVDGGIWLNTQRPEWNDANNALVGQGLSMVTLCYMRRYVTFLQHLLDNLTGAVQLSTEVGDWLVESAAILQSVRGQLGSEALDARQRYRFLAELGSAASRYRQTVYAQGSFSGTAAVDAGALSGLLDDALAAIDHSIRTNRRPDGLYHAYNLLELAPEAAGIDTLYPMLEGQVAVLSSGAVAPAEAVALVQALFDSDLYRPDQNSFLLYPDRKLPSFLEKNRVPSADVEALPVLKSMLAQGEHRIIERDAAGTYRFNAELTSVSELDTRLDGLASVYGKQLQASRQPLRALYEQVFDHKAFTGRSGGMFGFEGLGSIYWHMVAKLLLAVQENFFAARRNDPDDVACEQLATLYYRVREGIGFNKSPAEYGAFPTDPYSHTPGHSGAQQPGMTGQVKEEMLTRFAELGVHVRDGQVHFDPALLRAREFIDEPQPFRFLDTGGQWQELEIPANGLAFTWCQVPVIYQLADAPAPCLTVHLASGSSHKLPDLCMPAELAGALFQRSGRIRRIELTLARSQLHSG